MRARQTARESLSRRHERGGAAWAEHSRSGGSSDARPTVAARAKRAELIDDLYGLEVSPATLLAWIEEAGQMLRPAVESITQALIEAPVVHADESGLRVASCLHWLHTAASETHTWYGVHTKRGMEAIEAHGILPKRIATLVHDCWKPYWKLECVHALCNAHLLRELVFLHESTGQTWPQCMIDILIS
ncbi:hypothetical protein NTG1052_500004 [Candidatus Nitrotoga sp. 1052]|nr:hypothetical protein NTG1052_500004 [Candidatus Nitrotoga sp. 1052]